MPVPRSAFQPNLKLNSSPSFSAKASAASSSTVARSFLSSREITDAMKGERVDGERGMDVEGKGAKRLREHFQPEKRDEGDGGEISAEDM
jgi:hypothetical protein